MKKIVFTITIIISALLLGSFSAAKTVSAQIAEDGLVEVAPSGVATTEVPQNVTTESARVNYELPYPGMLPDNPFYFLKVLRDRIVKSLITNPFQAAKFSLLTSQKRMYAGKLLVDKKKYDLAFETIEKSNNYLLDAINAIKKEQKDNPKSSDIRPFWDQVRTVALKHKEVLQDIKPRVGKKYEQQIRWQLTRVEDTRKNAETYLLQKQK